MSRVGRAEHDAAMLGVEQGKAGDVLGGAAEPDHHRHAARARQHGHMARRAALRQRDAAAGRPVRRQEARRRDVLAEQDRARRSCPIPRSMSARRAPADVYPSGRRPARGNIRRPPLHSRRSRRRARLTHALSAVAACVDRVEGRAGERIVGEHGSWNSSMSAASPVDAAASTASCSDRRFDRGLQRLRFRRRRAFGDIAARHRSRQKIGPSA